MAHRKLVGSPTNVLAKGGSITEGLGFPLLDYDVDEQAIGMPTAPNDQFSIGAGGSWADYSAFAGGLKYFWDGDTTATDPGVGTIKANSSDLSSVTEIYMNDTNFQGVDFGSVLDKLRTGDEFLLSRFNDQLNHNMYVISAPCVNNGGGFWTIPVAHITGQGDYIAGAPVEFLFFFISQHTPQTLYGTEQQYEESESVSDTSSSSFQNKLILTTPAVPAGEYQISWSLELANSSNNTISEYRVRLNNSEVIAEGQPEFRNSGDFMTFSGIKQIALINAVHMIDIDWRAGGATASIRRARINLIRVS